MEKCLYLQCHKVLDQLDQIKEWKSGLMDQVAQLLRVKKRKNTCTNDDSQASSFVLDAHDKGDLCPWVLEIKHCTYKFLSEKIFEQVRVNPNILVKAVQEQLQHELEVHISMSKAFRAKAKAEREIKEDHILRDLLGLDGAFMKGPFPGQVLVAVGLDSNNGIYPLAYALVEAESKSSWYWFLQCLGDDIDLHPNLNFTFISDRQKRAASATNVSDFEKCKLELKMMNPKVFNGKIVGGRDKPVITLLEYIREYCMKIIVNVQGVIDKCTGPLTPTATKIMESIKKEAHLMKVQWNGSNKYQVSGGNNAEASGSATRQAQQTEPVAGQDGLGGSGAGAVIGLSTAAGEGGPGASVASQGSSHSRWTKRRVQTERISPRKKTPTQPASQSSTSSQVSVSETRNADGREMGDGVPT
ncbi:mutator type transposase [Tanacetum coccineum]